MGRDAGVVSHHCGQGCHGEDPSPCSGMTGWGPITAGRDAKEGTHHCGQGCQNGDPSLWAGILGSGPITTAKSCLDPLLSWRGVNVTGSSPSASASHCLPHCSHPSAFPQVLDYDYYGAYGQERHRDYTYNRLLGDEYTFDFPPHHDIVSAGGSPHTRQNCWAHLWLGGLEELVGLRVVGSSELCPNLGKMFQKDEEKCMACAQKAW